MSQPYPDEYEDYDDYSAQDDYSEYDDEITPRPSNRGPVGIFLLGWLLLPTAAVLLSDLQSPWFEVASLMTLAFIALFVWACVRVVKNF